MFIFQAWKESERPTLIQQIDVQSEHTLYLNIFSRLKVANGIPNDVIDTYIDALLYKPTNHAHKSVEGDNPTRTYLFDTPTRLPKHLEEFAINEQFKSNYIFPRPKNSTCRGVGNPPHQFLSSDEVKNCPKYNHVVCKECHDKIEKELYCFRATLPNPLVDSLDVQIPN